MAKNIYLASRGAFNSTLFGHLYFILWDDELETGRTTEGQGIGKLRGEIDLSNTDENSSKRRAGRPPYNSFGHVSDNRYPFCHGSFGSRKTVVSPQIHARPSRLGMIAGVPFRSVRLSTRQSNRELMIERPI